MKGNHWFIAGIIVFLVLMFAIECRLPKKFGTGELLRDVKNMLIVVNTLLRKAAESGGVHPVYIDQLSGALAVKIERVADTVEANRLGLEMLLSLIHI